MLMVIDVGNSEICFGIVNLNDFSQEKLIIERARFSTMRFRNSSHQDRNKNLKTSLNEQLSQLNMITTVVIACVAPAILPALKEFCINYLTKSVFVVGQDGDQTDVDFPTQALVDNPNEVGADLRINTYAAHAFYQEPAIVVGFGTATTLSLVNDQGEFCGTMIAPGLGLMSQALPQVATHLPYVDFKKPCVSLGLNTIDAMELGLFWGYISLVEGLIKQLQYYPQTSLTKGFDPTKPLKVIATGGYAALVAPYCAHITIVDSDLTLKGLALIFNKKLKGK